uniref:uncharacterized protein LOC117165271 n=1 Tax=Bombus vancouverensis nearcticus TaxID=2705178 RepID=UPI00143C6B3D
MCPRMLADVIVNNDLAYLEPGRQPPEASEVKRLYKHFWGRTAPPNPIILGSRASELIEERVDGREEEVVIISGDWNARTGEEGGSINEDVGKEKNRRSKDKTINMEGRTLLKIINGSDKEGEERTYIGERGNSVLDYVIGNQEATEEIIYMKIGKRTESGHMPLE